MSGRGRVVDGPVAGALAAVAGWLVEPAAVDEPSPEQRTWAQLGERPLVAVVGLARRCGTTTVARALGAELAARDPGGACAVTSSASGRMLPLGLPAGARLARTLAPLAGGRVRSCGRLCLVEGADRAALVEAVRHLAPLVMDVEHSSEAPVAAALAGTVILCGSAGVEEALAPVVAASLGRVGPDPVVVLNRAGPGAAWETADIELPDSRMGAQLALAGREPRGDLGRAVAELADIVERGLDHRPRG